MYRVCPSKRYLASIDYEMCKNCLINFSSENHNGNWFNCRSRIGSASRAQRGGFYFERLNSTKSEWAPTAREGTHSAYSLYNQLLTWPTLRYCSKQTTTAARSDRRTKSTVHGAVNHSETSRGGGVRKKRDSL